MSTHDIGLVLPSRPPTEFSTLTPIYDYRLSQTDVDEILRRRTHSGRITRLKSENPPQWPHGAQAHVGAQVSVGDVLPLIVTKRHVDGRINGQVMLDGSDTLWVQQVSWGSEPGQYADL